MQGGKQRSHRAWLCEMPRISGVYQHIHREAQQSDVRVRRVDLLDHRQHGRRTDVGSVASITIVSCSLTSGSFKTTYARRFTA